jgi:hypothetical protein
MIPIFTVYSAAAKNGKRIEKKWEENRTTHKFSVFILCNIKTNDLESRKYLVFAIYI